MGNTPLHWAYRYNFTNCVAALIDFECSEKIENKDGKRPNEMAE